VRVDGSVPARPLRRGRELARSWFWTVTGAEFAGFTVPACVGALTATAAPTLSVPALLAAGAVEGGLLGLGQATVLRGALRGFRRGPWVLATAAAAVSAYAIGLTPSTFAGAIQSWPVALQVGLAVVLGATLLASIGLAQWLILRRYVPRASRWIATTALAWTVGISVFLVFTMPLWQPGQPMALTVIIGIGGGLLMAATTSAITGAAVVRLLPADVRGPDTGPRTLVSRADSAWSVGGRTP
jgi:hypothetical protein